MVQILIVDDESAILRMLTYALKKEGYNVLNASNGRLGLNVALQERPSLIISDVMMPEMDGMEMCRQIRESELLKDVPFIFLTAKGDMSTRIQGLQLGADDFITKPIDLKKLMKKVKEILSHDLASDFGLSEPELFHEVHLSGNFAEKKVSSVLQVIESQRLTGVFTVDELGRNAGEFSFYKGNLLDATYKNKQGREAIFLLLSEGQGEYRFVVKPLAIEDRSPLNVSTLIMEWTTSNAQIQEKKTRFVISRQTRFEIVLVPDFFKLTSNQDVQQVIQSLQKGGTAGHVLDNSGLSQERVLKIFKYLLAKGILKERG